jgi:hypothetical protein
MLNAEERLTMGQVRALLNGRDPSKPISRMTLHRWYRCGMRGVILRTELHGGARITCERWLDEFFNALKEARDGKPDAAPARKPARSKPPPAARDRRKAVTHGR